MAKKLDPQQLVSVEELAISSMWEIAAIVEVLERKGICKKQDLYDAIQDLRRKTPKAQATEQPFPEPYLNTQAENALIDRVFELFNATGLTAHQPKNQLDRVRRFLELGERTARKTTH